VGIDGKSDVADSQVVCYKSILFYCFVEQLLLMLHRMHDMQTVVTDVSGVCQSVHKSVRPSHVVMYLRCQYGWSRLGK